MRLNEFLTEIFCYWKLSPNLLHSVSNDSISSGEGSHVLCLPIIYRVRWSGTTTRWAL